MAGNRAGPVLRLGAMTSYRASRPGWTLIAVAIAVPLVLAGCTDSPGQGGRPTTKPYSTGGAVSLVAFDSCEQALDDLQGALSPYVGPYGLGTRRNQLERADTADRDQAASPGEATEEAPPDTGAEPEHSSTNTHEAGVDEPDVVKTDGKRIVSALNGVLRVVDAASQEVTGTLRLSDEQYAGDVNLLLSGDHALAILGEQYQMITDAAEGEPVEQVRAELLLVDLTSQPEVRSRFTIDGRYVDARMVGQTARVVTHSEPRLRFTDPSRAIDEPAATRHNLGVVAESTIDDWLPRYELTSDRGTSSGRVDCASLVHPSRYTAASMLSVLSFDLGAGELGTGDPVSVVADGDIVYGTADSLYVANDPSRAFAVDDMAMADVDMDMGMPVPIPGPGQPAPEPPDAVELYQFDTSGTGKPVYVGSGTVPGRLLNQYSMSEYAGVLRVATTTDAHNPEKSQSAVYTLRRDGEQLTVAGQVGGLGKGEQIYAVRFLGPVGYVVTFRQTDPLYTLDLSDPASPKVVGELKITGYSAYLHPAGDGMVIGVGQEATEQGQRLGAQVSLFDVADPARPTRVAQHHVAGGETEAEYDPHAFLYWAKTKTMVLPMMADHLTGTATALALKVGDGQFTELGELTHDLTDEYYPGIRRSLVIGDTLWTLSGAGLAANDLASMADRGWVSFD